MQATLIIERISDYELNQTKKAVKNALDHLAKGKIKSGDSVLIKPNLLSPAKPHQAITTHPVIIKAIAEYVLDMGARPTISDSPAIGSFSKVISRSGIGEALRGLDVVICEFKETVLADIGRPFGKIPIAKGAIESDFVINVPKLKTHSQMLLTLAVKNMFGCIVGGEKTRWHLRTGVDHNAFAELLCRICKVVNPSISVLDGILGMHGEGPGIRGKPVKIGLMAASDNPLAIDIFTCLFLGINPIILPTNKAASILDMIPYDIEIVGNPPPPPDEFKLPGTKSLLFGPEFATSKMREFLLEKPVPDRTRCTLCKTCEKHCPSKAISISKSDLHIDYKKCIRCFCCIEMCPEGAMGLKEPAVSRIVKKFLNAGKRR